MIHMYDTDIAKEFGVISAVLVYKLQLFSFDNKKNGRNCFDGHVWVRISVATFARYLPEFTRRQIERGLEKLVSGGVLLKAAQSSEPFDKTMRYAFADEERFLPDKVLKMKLENGSNNQKGLENEK